MDRPACSQLRTKLQEIKELKAEFDLELSKIKDTRNTELALVLEEKIREGIRFIRESLILACCEWAEIIIGDRSKEELIKELVKRENPNNPEDKIYIWENARNMLQNPDFTVINKPEKIALAKLKVKDLGFKQHPTTDEIYQRAKELGLELCSPEIGPHLRLNYEGIFKREQPKNEELYIGMKQIYGRRGFPAVFYVHRDDDGERWLSNHWADPKYSWSLECEFIFARK